MPKERGIPGPFLRGRGPSPLSRKGRWKIVGGFSGALIKILEGFWKEFERILEGFCQYAAAMLQGCCKYVGRILEGF